jgi:hypothetical protein
MGKKKNFFFFAIRLSPFSASKNQDLRLGKSSGRERGHNSLWAVWNILNDNKNKK